VIHNALGRRLLDVVKELAKARRDIVEHILKATSSSAHTPR